MSAKYEFVALVAHSYERIPTTRLAIKAGLNVIPLGFKQPSKITFYLAESVCLLYMIFRLQIMHVVLRSIEVATKVNSKKQANL